MLSTLQVGTVTVKKGVASPHSTDMLTFTIEALGLNTTTSLLQLNCGAGIVAAAAAARGVERVVVTDPSPMAISNALLNAKDLEAGCAVQVVHS